MMVNENLVGALNDCQMVVKVQSLSRYHQLYTCDLHVSQRLIVVENIIVGEKNISLVELSV